MEAPILAIQTTECRSATFPASDLACPKSDEVHDKGRDSSEDLITQLPDHILLGILSLLTLKEVAKICILSKRWQSLSSNIYVMNFDGWDLWMNVPCTSEIRDKERCQYINWVNQLLKSHKGSTIDEFRIRFDLDESFTNEIDTWHDFAITRRVKRLELNLTSKLWNHDEPYAFSEEFCDHIKTPRVLLCIKSLTYLSLRNVNVTAETVEHFLCNCPILESLIVHRSETLRSLKVVGSLPLQLKHLEIVWCPCLEEIEISAPNLVSLRYEGQKTKLCIGQAPLLAHVLIGWLNCETTFALLPLSSHLSQLESLHLICSSKEMNFPDKFELTKLKHLTVTAYASYCDSLLGIDSLIRASPNMHKLTLEMKTHRGLGRRGQRNVIRTPNQSLREVEIIGFKGYQIDFEIALYLLEIGTRLYKITNDRRLPPLGGQSEFEETKETLAAMQHALQFKEKLNPTVELVIL